MRLTLLLFLGSLALAGCVHARDAPNTVCPALKPYTQAEQDALAQALGTLPDGNPLAGAMVDYAKLRAAVRACHG